MGPQLHMGRRSTQMMVMGVLVVALLQGALTAQAATCGHNAVRHLQDAQLKKVHGEEYEQAHHIYREQRQQQGSSSGAARLLQAVKARQQPNSRLQKLLQDNQASTLRIQPVYQFDGGYLNSQQAAQVRDTLVPGAIRVLQQYIKVRLPAQRAVKAVREPMDQYCGEADAQAVFKGAGYSNTDHVYYFTAKKTGSCGENTIAYTIICHMEAFTFRPNVAAINLCPRFWTLGEPLGSKQVSALVHEMIHGLGFSDRMYPFLYDSQTGVQYEEVVREHQLGTPLSSSSTKHFSPANDAALKQPVQFQDGAKTAEEFEASAKTKVLFLVTPRLAAFARDYYACPSLPGAPADAFSEGSHWRQANVNHELMQPASAEDSQRKRISAFTLNFLEDTGWYVADKSAAQELEWGRGAGCAFVLDGCSSWVSNNKGKQSYYCSESQAGKDVCTHDSRGIGMCSLIPGTSCYTARADAAKPLMYCQDTGSFTRSGRQGVAAAFAAVGGAVGSQSSRCLNAPQKVCTGKACAGTDGSAICAETSCDSSGKLFVQLKVDGKTTKLPCTDGAVLDLTKLAPGVFKSGRLECPHAAKVCPTLSCSGGCANGYCWQGRCYCHLEFTGSSCSQSLVPSLWSASSQTIASNWRVPL